LTQTVKDFASNRDQRLLALVYTARAALSLYYLLKHVGEMALSVF
jgi:hypothetical protein